MSRLGFCHMLDIKSTPKYHSYVFNFFRSFNAIGWRPLIQGRRVLIGRSTALCGAGNNWSHRRRILITSARLFIHKWCACRRGATLPLLYPTRGISSRRTLLSATRYEIYIHIYDTRPCPNTIEKLELPRNSYMYTWI